jgi:hypothetical protein
MGAALCTSSAARQAILATCSGALQLTVDTVESLGDDITPEAKAAALARVNHQAACLAEYGRLIGQLQLRMDPSLEGADEAAVRAALRLPLQLQSLQLRSSSPAALLRQLEPSRLTNLAMNLSSCGAASQLLVAALSRLSSLRELAIVGSTSKAHASFAAVLSSMTKLTQLVLQQQLPAAALAQLPCQLVELHIAGPACDAAELQAHMQALQQLQTLKLAYDPWTYPALRRHKETWGVIPALQQLDIRIPPYH